MKTVLIALILLTVSSCKTLNSSGTKDKDLIESINYVVEYINNKIDGSNQINIDNKSQYDIKSEVLIVFIGPSVEDSYQRWELPLHDLDPESVIVDIKEFSGNKLTVTTKMNENKIRYYEVGELKSLTNEFNYYLGANATKREIKRFKNAFSQAVLLKSRE